MKPRQLLMGAALLAAAGLAFFGDKTPSSDIAEPAEHGAARVAGVGATASGSDTTGHDAPVRAAAPARASASATAAAEPAILALQPRAELIGEAGEAIFDGKDGLFLSQNWLPPPSSVAKAGPPPAPPAPVAPPLPFVYIGKAAGDGSWEVYLVKANKTYVVRKQTLIDGVYRVESISPPTMTITYLPLNQVQQLNIGVLD
jgi:hypothetical protein